MKKTLYVMRHGQTQFNALRKIQGWCDSPLTEKGMEQAKNAGGYFKENGITFNAAYCSTSERTSDTLELATDYSMPYTRLKALKEFNFGRFEGESEDLHPKGQNGFSEYYVNFGGESHEMLVNRVAPAVHEIMKENGNDTVLIVAHGGTNFAFLGSVLGVKSIAEVPEEERQKYMGAFANCGMVRYSYEDGVFSVEEVIVPKDAEVPVF